MSKRIIMIILDPSNDIDKWNTCKNTIIPQLNNKSNKTSSKINKTARKTKTRVLEYCRKLQ